MTTIEMTTTKTNGVNVNTISINTLDLNATNMNVVEKRKTKKKMKYLKNSGHKMHVCIFCKKEFPRLAEHFMRRHKNEDKVKDIMATTDKQVRMWKWKTLRQQGDHFFNVTENRGDRKLVKVPTHASNKSKYFNCPVCFARLRTCSKFEHKLVCQNVFKTNVDADLQEINKDIFVRMPESLINKIRKSSYVNGFLKQTFESADTRYFRNLCKDIIHLEEEMQKNTGQNIPLSCFLTSTHVDDFIKTIKDMGGQIKYGKERVIMRYPFRVQRFCRIVAHFCRYLTGYYSKRNFDRDLAELTKFFNAFQIDSERILQKQARRAIRIKQQVTPKRLPKTSDIKLLVKKLKEETPKLMAALRANSNRRTWRALAENVLCRLTIFNRRRGGAVERMKISDYTRTEVKLKTVTEESTYNLSPEDIAFLKSLRIVEILHKCDNVIPIYITKELQEPMDMLLKYRKYADDIHKKNDYFFAAGKNSLTSIRGVKVLERYRQILPERIKKYFTATTLRKHGATVAQVLDLSHQDIEEWAAHMGHSVQVHNKYYKMSEEVTAILKTGRVLTALNEGAIKYYKGKKISEIPLKTNKPKIKASASKTVLINQAEDYENEAENPKSTTPSSDKGAKSGADETPPTTPKPTDKGSTPQTDGTPPTTPKPTDKGSTPQTDGTPPTTPKPTDKGSTPQTDGTPVTILLVCSIQFPDRSGRSYVNLIPVTITPSLNKESGTCLDQIAVSTTSFPDPNARSYASVIPITSIPSLDLGAKSYPHQTTVPTTHFPDENPGFCTYETSVTTTPSLGAGAKSYTNQIAVPTTSLPDENATSETDETRVNILLKCTTPFRDQYGRPYVNLIPLTIILSPNNGARCDADETTVTTTPFPDANSRSYVNVIPATTTSPLDIGSRSDTNQVTSSYTCETVFQTDENFRSYTNEIVIPTTLIPDENGRFYTYETAVPITVFPHEHASFHKNEIAVQTTPFPDANPSSYSDENSRSNTNETVIPITRFPDENARSSTGGYPVTNTRSPDKSSTRRADGAPGTIEFCTEASPDRSGKSCVTTTPPKNREERTSPGQMSVVTTSSPAEVVKLNALRSSVIVSPSQKQGIPSRTDEIPATPSWDKNSRSCENVFPVTATPPQGIKPTSCTVETALQTTSIPDENTKSLEDEIPVPTRAFPNENIILNEDGTSASTTPLPKENATSHAIGIPVIITSSTDKVAKSCAAETPATTLPIPEENVESRMNELPAITTPPPQNGSNSNHVETPATASTSPDKTVRFFSDEIPTTITPAPGKDDTFCNDSTTVQIQEYEKEKPIDSHRQETPTRKEMKSSELCIDDDRKRKRREYFQTRRILAFESGSDSPKEEYQSLPVKKRLFQRYCSGNGSNESDESTHSIKAKNRKKRKRQSTKSKSLGSKTPTKKAKTRKTLEPVKLTFTLSQENSDDEISDCSSNYSSDSSVFF